MFTTFSFQSFSLARSLNSFSMLIIRYVSIALGASLFNCPSLKLFFGWRSCRIE